MKKLVTGDLIPIKLAVKPCKKVLGFKIKHLGSYKAGSVNLKKVRKSLIVSKWHEGRRRRKK